MTSASFLRAVALLAALASPFVLTACGGKGGGSSGPTTIRAINLSSDLPSVDVFTDTTSRFAAQATSVLSSNIAFDSGTYTFNVKKAGDGATLKTGAYSLAPDRHYTAVVWGRQTSLQLSTLPEDENTADISTGNARLRVFNATVDTGTVDVYLTSAGANVADVAATQSALTSGTLSGFKDVSAGTYRLVVTGEKNPNDIRLDIPAMAVTAQTYNTLVLTAGAGGVLVNGTLIAQQGAATSLKNGKARLRLAAGVNNQAGVSATYGGTTVSATALSPRVGGYVVVPANQAAALVVSVNGVAKSTTQQTFAEGGDYTVLAYGPDTGATVNVVALLDDNRLPSTTTRAKVRLVNGSDGAPPLTLSLDFQPLQPTDIAVGSGSTYYAADATSASRIEISSPSAATALFSQTGSSTDRLLQNQGIYTVFMLGGLNANGVPVPTGVFRKDR